MGFLMYLLEHPEGALLPDMEEAGIVSKKNRGPNAVHQRALRNGLAVREKELYRGMRYRWRYYLTEKGLLIVRGAVDAEELEDSSSNSVT